MSIRTSVKQMLVRQQDKKYEAELAKLRRGIGHAPGELPELWGCFLLEMPESFQGRSAPSAAEWAVYLALTLYALHQQGEENVSMNEKGCTLGRAVRLLAKNSAAAAQDWTESSVLRRFNALATADSMPEVSHYLRGMVQLFRGNEPKLKLDYPRLAVELYRFQLPDQAANVRLQWGRDLYQMNADTPETEEKEN